MHFGLLCGYAGEDSGWVRIWTLGPGIAWTRLRPLFSERMGHTKPFARVGRWRFFWLVGVKS